MPSVLRAFCSFQVMLDTVGPELQVLNKTEKSISLKEDAVVVLTPNQELEATSELLPINFTGLSQVWNFILLLFS